MIIELSGIDGSGKTTLAEKIFRYINESDSGKSAYLREIKSNSKRLFNDCSKNSGFKHWKDYFGVEAVELAHCYEMISSFNSSLGSIYNGRDVYIMDTYKMRWLATAHSWGSKNMVQLAAGYSVLPRPDISINISVAEDVAYDRLESRVKGDHSITKNKVKKLDVYKKGFEIAEDLLPYEVIKITSLESIDQTFDQILPSLEKLVMT